MAPVRPNYNFTNDEAVFEMARQFLKSKLNVESGKLRGTDAALAILRSEARVAGEDEAEREDYLILSEIARRKAQLQAEQDARRDLHRRFDNLYHADIVTDLGGADHWPTDPSAFTAGKVHVSVNVGAAFVNIPSTLQAVTPIFNYIAEDSSPEAREQATLAERLFFRWWDENDWEVKAESACLTKCLYGETAAKVYWDAVDKVPRVSIIEQPSNLYLGYGDSDFSRLDWALYCYSMSAESAEQEWDVEIEERELEGQVYTWVKGTHDDPLGTIGPDTRMSLRRRLDGYRNAFVEVYDYWYKEATGPGKKPEVWNAIYIGNRLVEHRKHPEYGGELPYVPLTNGRVPGTPYGKPELYDVEQLLREKDERITEAGQMIHQVVGGQMWQLVGAEAPDEVPPGAIPKPNRVATPGPGNELRALQPFVPQFAVEDYNTRIDREIAVVTGLNDLLLGLAPPQILGSSKAINALVANYEARISYKRKLLYAWYRRVWELSARVWEAKSRDVRDIIRGNYRIDVKSPALTPRDEMEIAQMAINLVQNRLWSAERAMDRTGIEDPADEKNLIREEQTDGSLNPAAVLTQMQLLQGYQALGVQPPAQPGAAPQGGMAAAQAQSLNAARTLNPPQAGSASMNGPENAANPPAASQPANTPEGGSLMSQTMINSEGELQGRVLSQQQLG